MSEDFRVGIVENKLVFLIDEVANFKISPFLKKFFFNASEYENVIFSLPKTKYIDSSFIGAVLACGVKNKEVNGKKGYIYTNQFVYGILKRYGIGEIFEIFLEPKRFDTMGLEKIELPDLPKNEYLSNMLEDHKLLSQLSPENRKILKDLISGLENELKKVEE